MSMNQVFNELLDVKKLVNQLFDKMDAIEKLEYDWNSSTEWRKAKYKLEDEIKEIKNELKKLL
jgi:hypothetical protein